MASGGSTGSGGSGVGGIGSGTGGPGSEGSPGSTGVIGVSTGVGELSREPSRERDGDSGRDRERPRVSSLLGTRATAVTSDEDELSMFVREIDARKPLATGSGRGRVLRSVHHPAVAEGSRGGVVGLGIGGAGTGAGTGGVLQVENAGGAGAVSGGGESGLTKGSVASAAAAPAARPGPGSGPDPIITADPNPSAAAAAAAGTTDSRRSSTLGGSGPMLTREAEIDERLRHMHEVFMASLEGLGSGARRGAQTSAAGEESPVGGGGSASASGSGSGSAIGAQRPRLGSMRSLSGGDGASSGGSGEVLGRMELDEEARRRRRFDA